MDLILDVSEFQSPSLLDEVLSTAPDTIVCVYIKATQNLSYRDHLATVFAEICRRHKTLYGYYDYMANTQANAQEEYFRDFVLRLPPPSVIPLLDCEGAYAKYAAGALNWQKAAGSRVAVYSDLNDSYHYTQDFKVRFIAQYPLPAIMRAEALPPGAVAAYKSQGYTGWQFTDSYMGFNLDASVLLVPIEVLKL